MDKRNPKQTCENCAYFKDGHHTTMDTIFSWVESACYFPLIPTEEPRGVPVDKDDYCREWYYGGKKVEPEPDRLQRLEEKVHGLEQVIVELITAVGLEPKDFKPE